MSWLEDFLNNLGNLNAAIDLGKLAVKNHDANAETQAIN